MKKKQTYRAALLLFVYLIAIGVSAFAQALDPSIPEGEKKALELIAEYNSSGLILDRELAKVGYKAPLPAAEWRKMPTIRKLEVALFAAKRGNPQTGGGRFLAMLSKNLAQSYQAASGESALRPYFAMDIDDTLPTYAENITEPSKKLPSKKERKAIITIASYLEGELGSQIRTLENMGLGEEKAYKLLRESESFEKALTKAYTSVPEGARYQTLAKAAKRLAAQFQSAAHDKALRDFLTPGGAQSVTPGSPSGISPANFRPPYGKEGKKFGAILKSKTRTSYSKFIAKSYKTIGRGFQKTVRFRGGFGGVIFGNEVTSKITLGEGAKVTWRVSSKDASKVILLFDTGNGSNLTCGPIEREDAIAAARIVNGDDWKDGNMIGLVGIVDPVPSWFFGRSVPVIGDEGVEATGVKWNVVVHPSIQDLELGWSAMIIDILRIMEYQFTGLAREVNQGTEFRKKLEQFAKLDIGDTYKYFDAPTELKASGDRLKVVAQDSSPNTFLRFKTFTEKEVMKSRRIEQLARQLKKVQGEENKKAIEAELAKTIRSAANLQSEASKTFVKLLPELCKVSHHIARANDFAAVLAVVRWAKANGAQVEQPKFELDPCQPVPPSVIVTKFGFSAAKHHENSAEVYEDIRKKISQKIDAVVDQLPLQTQKTVRELKGKLQQEGIDRDEKKRVRVSLKKIHPRLTYWLNIEEKYTH